MTKQQSSTKHIVTRTCRATGINSGKVELLRNTARPLLRVRSDVWRMFSGRKKWSKIDARNRMKQAGLTADFYGVPYNIWANCVEDTVDNINMWREAQLIEFKRFVFSLNLDAETRKRVFTEAKVSGIVRSCPAASRHLRKAITSHSPEAKSKRLRLTLTKSTYDMSYDDYGRLWLGIATVRKGERVHVCFGAIPYDVRGTINVIVNDDNSVELHLPVEEFNRTKRRKPRKSKSVGIDAGMSEVVTTSDGEFLGTEQGERLNHAADKRREKGRARGKAHAIKRKHEMKAEDARQRGDLEFALHHERKAANIELHNLGRVKADRALGRHKQRIRTLQFEAVHELCDYNTEIVAENLNISGRSRKRTSRQQQHRLSSWQRSSLRESLESVTRRRGSTLTYVNPAYTSQQVHSCGHLGVRSYDTVYCDTFGCRYRGVREHADVNAARNILSRAADSQITLFMPYSEVRLILESRMRTNHPRHANGTKVGTRASRQSVSEKLKSNHSKKC